jgi:S1-C subfamily serine protease
MGLPETFQAVRPTIVALGSRLTQAPESQKPLFPTIIGTGFVVDRRGIVATNRHVADALAALPRHPRTGVSCALAILFTEVEHRRAEHGMGTLLRGIRRHWVLESFVPHDPYFGETMPDLAFLQLNVTALPAAELLTEPNVLKTGLDVATAGFPLGEGPLTAFNKVTQLTPLLRKGVISSVYPFPCPRPDGFTVDVTTQGGASGSPIFQTDSPKILGMVQAVMVGGENITIALPSTLISEALEKCLGESELDLTQIPELPDLLRTMERTPELKYETL